MIRRIAAIVAIALCAASCVIPGPPDELIDLAAKPERTVVPLGAIFEPEKDLRVTALFNTGEAFVVPAPDWSASSPPDTSMPGERSGSVEYAGKTATYSIFVYDDSTGPYSGGGGGPEMHVPL